MESDGIWLRSKEFYGIYKESDWDPRNLSIYSDLIESDAALRAGAIF